MATGIKKQEYDFKGVTITDANNAPYGISSISYSNANAPFSNKHATIITTANEGGEWKQQIAVPWYGTEGIAVRRSDNQGNWYNWNEFLSKNGDTMTNSLTISTTTQNYFVANKPNYDSTLATQASDIYTRGFVITDKDNRKVGQFRSVHLSENNRLYTEMVTSRVIGGTEYVHTFGITIDSEGNRGVSLTRAPWITALGLDVESGNCILNTTNCSTGVIVYKKWGHVIMIYTTTAVKLKETMTGNTIEIGTVPSGYRPVTANYYAHGGNDNFPCNIWINTSGSILFTRPAYKESWANTLNIYVNAMYYAG